MLGPEPMLNASEILKLIPHRDPFVFIDGIVAYEPGRCLRAIQRVDPAAWYFKGHFPKRSLMPGVLVGEALAQSCAAYMTLSYLQWEPGKALVPQPPDAESMMLVLGSIKIAFTYPVDPGTQLNLTVYPLRILQTEAYFKLQAQVQEHVCAHGCLTLASRPGIFTHALAH